VDGALYNESLVGAFLTFEKGEYDAFGLPPDTDMDSRYDCPFVGVAIAPESSITDTSGYSSSTWGTSVDGALYNESLVGAFLTFEKGE